MHGIRGDNCPYSAGKCVHGSKHRDCGYAKKERPSRHGVEQVSSYFSHHSGETDTEAYRDDACEEMGELSIPFFHHVSDCVAIGVFREPRGEKHAYQNSLESICQSQDIKEVSAVVTLPRKPNRKAGTNNGCSKACKYHHRRDLAVTDGELSKGSRSPREVGKKRRCYEVRDYPCNIQDGDVHTAVVLSLVRTGRIVKPFTALLPGNGKAIVAPNYITCRINHLLT